MVQDFLGETSIFPHSKRFESGGGNIRAGQATIVVAKDGSGDSDDVQEGIDMLPPGGGVVFIKEGTYTISTSIVITKDNTTLRGTGRGSKIQAATATFDMITATSVDYILIEDLFIAHGSQAAQNDECIDLTSCDEGQIRNCWFEYGDETLELDDCDNFVVSSNIFNISNGHAISFSDSSKMTINNNIIISPTSSGISCDSTPSDSTISNNVISGAGSDGIDITGGDRVTITGNIVILCGKRGIELADTQESAVTGNVCKANTFSGISVRSGSHKNTITGNECSNNDSGSTSTYSGIFVDASDNNTITGNNCHNNKNYGIDISNATSDKNVVVSNICLSNTNGQVNDAGTGTENAHNITA
jgi:parallel beta-helix repeat protein